MSGNQQILLASGGADTIPDAFSFTDQTGVATSSTITSNTITPTGYTGPTNWTCSGGTASVNGGGYTTSGTITPGQTVTLRATSSASWSTAVSVTFTAGTVSDVWSVTTMANPVSQIYFTASGSWTVPAGVTSVSVVCITPGESPPLTKVGGKGGNLAYGNNIPVTPGEVIDITINATTGYASFRNTSTLVSRRLGASNGGSYLTAGFVGGAGGVAGTYAGGGGGAAGYYGNGGNGGTSGASGVAAGANSGGGGGGGGGIYGNGTAVYTQGGGGGGVGYGVNGTSSTTSGVGGSTNGGGGGGAFLGFPGGLPSTSLPGPGGSCGGGAGGSAIAIGTAGTGAVRIIWPGNLRQFPATRVANE